MNLIVDIGNTSAKLAVMEDGQVVAQRTEPHFRAESVDELLALCPVERAIVGSTRGDMEEVAAVVRERIPCCTAFTHSIRVPLRNAYATPETLGRDRLAAAVGAAVHFPGRNVLIVDFGTALTVDLVTSDGTFRGGFISPGMQSRFRVLHEHTARLPLCEATEQVTALGTTTVSAVVEGVMGGMTCEIEGRIARMQSEYDDLCVIFTGGDAKYFVKRIKNTIFADQNLVFCGLNRILEYNASE